MLAFSNDYYGFIFRATQSVELFCAYEIDKDLNKTLNLNSMGQRLPENRKIKLDSVISELTRKFSKGTWSTERLESFIEEYSKPDAEGKKRNIWEL